LATIGAEQASNVVRLGGYYFTALATVGLLVYLMDEFGKRFAMDRVRSDQVESGFEN
jgi:flagellar biogenesis protein FliO